MMMALDGHLTITKRFQISLPWEDKGALFAFAYILDSSLAIFMSKAVLLGLTVTREQEAFGVVHWE